MTAIVKCPTCRRPVEWSEKSPYRPFCSERCRLVDLGAWVSERHSIPDEAANEEWEGAEDPDAAPKRR
ncbi:MAG: DNA gyrase inhibitor YacG [Steroidobacterales bacterium]